MRFVLFILFLIGLVCAHDSVAWTHINIGGCSLADGSCSPANCSVQHANFFTGYAAGRTYATRPNWGVAGVDYAVGQNCAGSGLADPATVAVPSGWKRNGTSQTFTCTAANPATLSGIDFSLEGGWQILDSSTCSGNVLITNIKMAVGSFADAHFFEFMKFTAGTENVTVSYSTLDGNGCNFTNQAASILWQINNASLMFQYNWLLNLADQGIVMQNNGGDTTNVTMQYNLLDVVGYASRSHNQFLFFGNPTVATIWSSSVSIYNTVYIPPYASGAAPAIGLCRSPGTLAGGLTGAFYHTPNANGTISSVVASNNTISVPLESGKQNGYLIRADGPGSVKRYTAQNNYMDDRGAFGYFTSSGVTGSKACSGNKNLISGASITGSVGGMTCS